MNKGEDVRFVRREHLPLGLWQREL